MKKKKILFVFICLIILSTVACARRMNPQTETTQDTEIEKSEIRMTPNKKDSYIIGMLQYLDLPSQSQVQQGFLDALSQAGYEEGKNIAILRQTASTDDVKKRASFLSKQDCDMLFAISTPAAQAAASATIEIPVLAASITDFRRAQLVETDKHPNTNVTGVSDNIPPEESLALIQKLYPGTKTIGILRTNEVNSRVQSEGFRKKAEDSNINCIEKNISSEQEAIAQIEAFASSVDVLFLPADNTIASFTDTFWKSIAAYGLPTFATDSDLSQKGALVCLSPDYYKIGLKAGETATLLFSGADVKKIPIQMEDSRTLSLNQDTANRLGLLFPNELIDQASLIIKNGQEIEVK